MALAGRRRDVDLIRGFDEIYERLDITIYSPLCLFLGIGTATVAQRAFRAANVDLPARRNTVIDANTGAQ
ncbi:MAG: hypothetical protein MSC31_04970 [Solirubrobacteraceae bacterium MAG38_C4-C5]|nr:hypothetical protein [Candidatus Siliceabacter maunaloa]